MEAFHQRAGVPFVPLERRAVLGRRGLQEGVELLAAGLVADPFADDEPDAADFVEDHRGPAEEPAIVAADALRDFGDDVKVQHVVG